jgi:hypothetical protein
MKEFTTKMSETPDQTILEISGAIDNAAKFPSIRAKKKLILKFSDVTLMNSYGIKIWCKWAVEHKDLPAVFLEECPFVFAKNFSSIRGFLGSNMKVRSFYVPYYNDESHETKNILMIVGKNFTEDGVYSLPKVVDSKGAEMEIDIDKSSYFQFLKKS